MTKFYLPNADEVRGATPLSEGIWFPRYQSALLLLANTNEGRDLLCLDSWIKRPYPITFLDKKMVDYHQGQQGGRDYTISDVRVGAKWGNVIRFRWQEISKALDRTLLLEMRRSWKPLYDRQGKSLAMIGGGSTVTHYPQPHGSEVATCDGYATENTDSNWDTMHDAAGDTGNDTETGINARVSFHDGSTWELFDRAMHLYDATAIANDATLASATMEFVTTVADHPFGGSMALVASAPASDTAIVAGDYDSTGTTLFADAMAISGINDNGSTYNSFALIAAGLSAVSFSAITKLACIIESDRTDTEPGSPGDFEQDFVLLKSSENSGTTIDEKLVIIHSISKSMLLMFPHV